MSIPFCKDCKHLVGRRNYPEHAESWLCGHPSNILGENTDSVTGEVLRSYRISRCYSMRTNLLYTPGSSGEVINKNCGEAGAWFEPYVQPHYEGKGSPAISQAARADELFAELVQTGEPE